MECNAMASGFHLAHAQIYKHIYHVQIKLTVNRATVCDGTHSNDLFAVKSLDLAFSLSVSLYLDCIIQNVRLLRIWLLLKTLLHILTNNQNVLGQIV